MIILIIIIYWHRRYHDPLSTFRARVCLSACVCSSAAIIPLFITSLWFICLAVYPKSCVCLSVAIWRRRDG